MSLLNNEALSVKDIATKLNIKEAAAYNAARRQEHLGALVAFDVKGKTVFLNKDKAEKEGLI